MVILICEQCQRIPFEFRLGDLQFFWIEAAGFCKNRGVTTGVDVMLDPMVRCRLHIPGAKNRGKFLQKNFDIIRHGIWDFLKHRGRD